MRFRGLALIVVVGVLGILAVLATAFVTMAQLERKASQQRVNAAKAYLLAKSGIEDALARIDLGQDATYLGEDWNASGTLDGLEAANEVYHPGVLDTDACPVRHALRPSFFVGDGTGRPVLISCDGRLRGYSGKLGGDLAALGNHYALKVTALNSLIYVNGGALDTEDRDPDGLGASPEAAPLQPNGVPDHRDVSMEGPNGFLVRLLDNLDAIVTSGATSNLGVQVVGARPVGGYASLEDLRPVLGNARFEQFRSYLTTAAWVDRSVVKPQPMDGRPDRFQDIDDAHRIGTEASEISGVHRDPSLVTFTSDGNAPGPSTPVTGPLLTLNPGIAGDGTESSPWVQTITASNRHEHTRTYPVTWERNFVYAWSQLRPAPPAPEPRAPVSLNGASREVLASVFLGLKGTYLETWDGGAGWDGGFGFYEEEAKYSYPDQATEETPWHRTRVDYGMTYGSDIRPWYGPASYNPHAAPSPPSSGFPGVWMSGRPVIQAAPLGRLRETPVITPAQALAISDQARRRIAGAGPFRTWIEFNAFVDHLPIWEDVNDDGVLDGVPYTVTGSGGTYQRRTYLREDLDSDGMMTRQIFAPASGSWAGGNIIWQDSGLGAGQRKAALPPGKVPGLTFQQKDVLKAMANPNTDLNDFNPDANLWKEVDKTDLTGLLKPGPPAVAGTEWAADPSNAYAHTTELALDDTGYYGIRAVGRVVDHRGKLAALRETGAKLRTHCVYRDTTQADFMRDYVSGARTIKEHFWTALPLPSGEHAAGGQPLVSYPEPQTVSGGGRAADASYDGQIGLGLMGADPGPDETFRGDLFDAVDAEVTVPTAQTDLRGPLHERLLQAGLPTGNVFPDGVYSEKDRTLKFLEKGNQVQTQAKFFYFGFWVKPNWFPEASPRAHALMSLSSLLAVIPHYRPGPYPWNVGPYLVPIDDIGTGPEGLYFVPARNNYLQEKTVGAYAHDDSTTLGRVWPSRSLIWGSVHSFYASDTVNRRGILNDKGTWNASPSYPWVQKPIGRLEAHRWQHVGMYTRIRALAGWDATDVSRLILGSVNASTSGGGGWAKGFCYPVPHLYADDSPNHLRFGEVAAENSMNYAADATFADVRAGSGDDSAGVYHQFLTNGSSTSPPVVGRYYKEHGATFTSARLPAGIRPLRVTWTEIPADLWFDQDGDGWLGDDLVGTSNDYLPRNDRFGAGGASGPNGLRDVRIDLEVWDDMGTPDSSDDVRLGSFSNPAADNRVPNPVGRLYYRAVFINEWDAHTRANFPLDVTPYLDDVTILYTLSGGVRIMNWGEGE